MHGICNLSIVPLRAEPSDKSEMVSQVLYGEFFEILEEKNNWSKIRLNYDYYEGWIDKKQYFLLSEDQYKKLLITDAVYSADLIEFITGKNELIPIPLGTNLNALTLLNHHFDGSTTTGNRDKSKIVETALLYLNAPYLWGGKTPFGIDCSGFTQMVYKINGYHLKRDASLQATQGEVLSFIEESEAGDLAFFDNEEGLITHVGIIMRDNHIIHAHGKVRIDRLDHHGIYNAEQKKHTHELRVIKKIIFKKNKAES